MPQLFTAPRFVAISSTNQLLPGAKLTFSITGTSTLQNVYQDEALTVAHSNPVTADGAGVFPKIYLDPSLPNYRVLLTDSALVTQPGYPLDDVPSNQNVAQTLRLKSAAPELILEETDAAANNGRWRIRVNAEQMSIDIGNDAESVWTNVATIDRTGTTVDAVDISAAVSVDSLLVDGDAPTASGSFVAELTGYASNLTPTIQWRRSGNVITLTCNAGSIGTSNANSLTMTGLPAAIQSAQSYNVITRLQDNGTNGLGIAAVAASGTITFGNGITGGAFTSSGNKGLPGGWSLSYEIG